MGEESRIGVLFTGDPDSQFATAARTGEEVVTLWVSSLILLTARCEDAIWNIHQSNPTH